MTAAHDAEGTAREFATRFLDGSFAEATGLLTEDGRDAVVDSFPDEFRQESMDAEDALEQYWWGLYGQYGESEGVEVTAYETGDDEVTEHDSEVALTFTFTDGIEEARIETTADGVADLSFAPTYQVPSYVDEGTFAERDLTVDVGDAELDGVLTVPDDSGPNPAVVLVHGAGVHDPDGTVGASRLLQDVAWGLAGEGVASLRYESRLGVHEVADERYTLDRVVVDDAVAAVDALAAADGVDGDGVFVAGHSQGGMAAPRIADRHGGVAGVVSLDGSADTNLAPEDADIIRYEFEIDGDLDEEKEAQVETDRETLRRIAAGEFDDEETLMGMPGVWHRSLNEYDPEATAADLDGPVFVANTYRVDEETQPEVATFLRRRFEAWQAADLPEGSRVTLYEGVDHFFQEGYAPTTPLSLYFGGTVAKHVVVDVAEWLHGVAGR